MRILGISGSLRRASTNNGLLRAACELAPANCEVEIFDLGQLPLFNQDLEESLPEPVSLFKKKIIEADAILIGCCEYNYSFSGVLKNALDWASRPYGQNAFDKKAVAMMGVSPSLQGSSRAQYQLRQVFLYLNMIVLNRPEVMINNRGDMFDEMGNLIDEKGRQKVKELLEALVVHANHHKGC